MIHTLYQILKHSNQEQKGGVEDTPRIEKKKVIQNFNRKTLGRSYLGNLRRRRKSNIKTNFKTVRYESELQSVE
jgi:ribosomal protein S3AE